MEVRILILRHCNELYYDGNHNGFLVSLSCLPSTAIVAPTQNGTPKNESKLYSCQVVTQRQIGSL